MKKTILVVLIALCCALSGCATAPIHQWTTRDVGNPSPYNGTSYTWNRCEVMITEDGVVWFSAIEKQDGEMWEQMIVFHNGNLNNIITQKIPTGIGARENESWRLPDTHLFSRNCKNSLNDFPSDSGRRSEILRLMRILEKDFGI